MIIQYLGFNFSILRPIVWPDPIELSANHSKKILQVLPMISTTSLAMNKISMRATRTHILILLFALVAPIEMDFI